MRKDVHGVMLSSSHPEVVRVIDANRKLRREYSKALHERGSELIELTREARRRFPSLGRSPAVAALLEVLEGEAEWLETLAAELDPNAIPSAFLRDASRRGPSPAQRVAPTGATSG
jgi:hypothetical protein